MMRQERGSRQLYVKLENEALEEQTPKEER